ncbi:hypothetical protein BB559_000406 [Furculomyces boomerangus]|uniref:CWH43-like N-terminal domain-containing protein n=2 Tax=Harpellales TaxID=61421 RepID=A0A2T9Z5H5_9FUNG|nr:hypothetical protein BB559_000406 [Furculomyces boomerangus]PVZ99201.1 hypothetical protein BB558_004783 [Smittium angustum]
MSPKFVNRGPLSDQHENSASEGVAFIKKHNKTSTEMKINGSIISILHTFTAYSAFILALIVGLKLHYLKIVKNEHYGYPDEWIPSVSATIGDRYPERNVFQILIALTCPFRLTLLILWFYTCKATALTKIAPKSTKLPLVVFIVGFLRTITAGIWVYITSSDDHDIHDVGMLLYMALTLPYMFTTISSSSNLTQLARTNTFESKKTTRYRKIVCFSFIIAIFPMLYWFIQHKVNKVAGAYSIYAIYEWFLIIADVLFDAVTYYEFKLIDLSIQISPDNLKSEIPLSRIGPALHETSSSRHD